MAASLHWTVRRRGRGHRARRFRDPGATARYGNVAGGGSGSRRSRLAPGACSHRGRDPCRNRGLAQRFAALIAVLLAACAPPPPADEEEAGFAAPRTPDGDPDLNGIWQALNTAHWDLEAHAARQGPAPMVGALGAIPAGLSVVAGDTIPYREDAAERRAANRANWLALDPAVKCYMPGIPRAVYMPFPFQFVQTPDAILVAYEFASTSRVIHLDRAGTEAELPSWMGHSLGHWDGDSLVVDVTAQVPDTWFDASGQLPQRRAARRRALYADRPGHAAVRGHDRGSQRLHAAVEDLHAALPATGAERPDPGVQVCRVRRGGDLRTPLSAGMT